MNFKEIIKQEWEKEFPNDLGEPQEVEDSLFYIYEELVERICTRVWNSALELAADAAETEYSFEQILKLKLDEQRTDTSEV